MLKKERVHFIGIGGIGVSALAQYYLQKGAEISGSDLAASEITEMLEKKGARIIIGKHKISPADCGIPSQRDSFSPACAAGSRWKRDAISGTNSPDMVVYSPAVRPNNPELVMAKKMGVKCLSYPEALGELTKKYFTVAVSGAHGKSTTTSMLALVLEKAGLDPTVIVGTKLKEFSAQGGLASGEGTNFRAGKSKYLVIEADEWQASFLNYWPKIIVLTNIDKEHLDYYKDLSHIMRTFREYIGHLPESGVLVANGEDKNISKLISNFPGREADSPKGCFPISPASGGIPSRRDNKFSIKQFSIKQEEAIILKKILKIPGEHNVSNALAVLTTARVLGIPDKTIFEAIAEYRGAWRRFEIKEARIGDKKFTIVSDYGHHPNEIKATLGAARGKFSRQRIWCIFQPHQYQRTFYLFNDFVKVFSSALNGIKRRSILDNLIITDIYNVEGREKGKIKKKVNSQELVKKINNSRALYLPKNRIKYFLEKNLKSGDIVIIMGAGDIYKLEEKLI